MDYSKTIYDCRSYNVIDNEDFNMSIVSFVESSDYHKQIQSKIMLISYKSNKKYL